MAHTKYDEATLDDIMEVLDHGELRPLQAITPPGFDWSAVSFDGVTPLQHVLEGATEDADTHDEWISVAKWLIDNGASPIQRAGDDAEDWEVWLTDHKEKTMISLNRARSTALSTALNMRKEMREAMSNSEDIGVEIDWEESISFLSKMVEIFSSSSSAMSASDRIRVSASVVDRWTGMLQDSGGQDLTIQTADGSCTVHASMMSIASPVVKASLSSTMMEGSTKKIRLDDCPLAAVKCLIEIVYTGGISEDVTASIAGHALELAHRWQVDDVVQMLEKLLGDLLTENTFLEVASRAQLLNLPILKQSCLTFARASINIRRKVQSKSLPIDVMTLLTSMVRTEGPRQKKRRML